MLIYLLWDINVLEKGFVLFSAAVLVFFVLLRQQQTCRREQTPEPRNKNSQSDRLLGCLGHLSYITKTLGPIGRPEHSLSVTVRSTEARETDEPYFWLRRRVSESGEGALL